MSLVVESAWNGPYSNTINWHANRVEPIISDQTILPNRSLVPSTSVDKYSSMNPSTSHCGVYSNTIYQPRDVAFFQVLKKCHKIVMLIKRRTTQGNSGRFLLVSITLQARTRSSASKRGSLVYRNSYRFLEIRTKIRIITDLKFVKTYSTKYVLFYFGSLTD